MRRVKVAEGAFLNGAVMVSSSPQSSVRQILTVMSSDCAGVSYERWSDRRTCVARYCPTGSQTTPLTKPWCPSSRRTSSAVGQSCN